MEQANTWHGSSWSSGEFSMCGGTMLILFKNVIEDFILHVHHLWEKSPPGWATLAIDVTLDHSTFGIPLLWLRLYYLSLEYPYSCLSQSVVWSFKTETSGCFIKITDSWSVSQTNWTRTKVGELRCVIWLIPKVIFTHTVKSESSAYRNRIFVFWVESRCYFGKQAEVTTPSHIQRKGKGSN